MITLLAGPTIKQGQSLSEPLDCTMGQLVRIHMPPSWDPAPLTFQISEGTTWFDLFDVHGVEVKVQTVVAGTAALVQVHQVREVLIRFRSGWRTNPIVQNADRNFVVALEVSSPQISGLPPQMPVLPEVVHYTSEGTLTFKP
jgi:hypothetical protein